MADDRHPYLARRTPRRPATDIRLTATELAALDGLAWPVRWLYADGLGQTTFVACPIENQLKRGLSPIDYPP